MFKKRLTISLAALITIALAFFALPSPVLAAAGDPGITDIWHWTELAGNKLRIDSCDAPVGNVLLPDMLDGKTVTQLGDGAFYNASGLTSIDLPATLEGIGYESFEGCSSLTSITIPKNVSAVGTRMFLGCLNLTSIQVDPANTNFVSEDGVLYDSAKNYLYACPATKSGAFTVPTSVHQIMSGAFAYCQNLTGVTLPANLDTIAERAFAYSGITSITCPKKVALFGYRAFYGCANLTKAVLLNATPLSLGGDMFGGTDIGADGIYGFAGTTVETYANTNTIPFHPLYTVHFQSGGSAVADAIVAGGDTLDAPADPTRSGFFFTRWYGDIGLGDPWDFSTDTVTDDITLYAGWDPTLTLLTSPTNAQIHTGESVTITPNILGGVWSFDGGYLSRNGNTFTGLATGTTRVTYTAGSQSVYVDVVITAAETPTQTPQPTATPSPAATTTPSPTAASSLQVVTSPADGKIFTGGRITVTPNTPGGTWEYPHDLLSVDISASGAVFTGLKAGTAHVTYTVGSQSISIDVVITQAGMPQTGQDFSPVLWLLIPAVCAGGAALAIGAKTRRKKRV